jgi:hypothetical protein
LLRQRPRRQGQLHADDEEPGSGPGRFAALR